MPKHENENKNGKNILKVLKTLDYSPVARYIKNVGCIFSNYSVGANVKFNDLADAYDNIGHLNGHLSLCTYNNNDASIPLRGHLYSHQSIEHTGVFVDNVDLTNAKAFVFSSSVVDSKDLDSLTYGLYNLFNSNNNNNNNNNSEPYYPKVTLSAGPLLLKDALYVSGNENIACFVSPNCRVYLIPSDAIVYLSKNPSAQISEYQNAQKSNQENNKSNDDKDKDKDKDKKDKH